MTLEFEPWYREVRDDLVASVAHAIADADRAEDAVDEALSRAVDRWELVASMRSPSGWAYTVALNAARRTLRRDATAARLLATSRTAESASIGEDLGFEELLALLTPTQAESVRYRHAEGMTEHEIAAVLGISRSTVSSRLRSAYAALATHLRPGRNDREDRIDSMELQLARVQSGNSSGCDVRYIDSEVTEHVTYSSAVRDTIRIRRDDLVAVDVAETPPEIVWRWWSGIVDSVEDETALTRRRTSGPDGSALVAVSLTTELAAATRPGATLWFAREGDGHVAVALAEKPDQARSRLHEVRQSLS